MTINAIFDGTSNLLVKNAQLRSRKAEVIAGNIANLDTPGYQARDFSFSQALREAVEGSASGLPLATTHPGHLRPGGSLNQISGSVTTRENQLGGLDRNSVDLDREMVEQAINHGAYSRSMQMLKSKMAILKNAIVEGGK